MPLGLGLLENVNCFCCSTKTSTTVYLPTLITLNYRHQQKSYYLMTNPFDFAFKLSIAPFFFSLYLDDCYAITGLGSVKLMVHCQKHNLSKPCIIKQKCDSLLDEDEEGYFFRQSDTQQ